MVFGTMQKLYLPTRKACPNFLSNLTKPCSYCVPFVLQIERFTYMEHEGGGVCVDAGVDLLRLTAARAVVVGDLSGQAV